MQGSAPPTLDLLCTAIVVASVVEAREALLNRNPGGGPFLRPQVQGAAPPGAVTGPMRAAAGLALRTRPPGTVCFFMWDPATQPQVAYRYS